MKMYINPGKIKILAVLFKSTVVLSIALFISQKAYSQSNDSINLINRKYQKEIGVDVQGLFLNTASATLIFKSKIKSGRFVELTTARNLRFQLGISGKFPTNQETTLFDTSVFKVASKEEQKIKLNLLFGLEKVNFYGRFNFYYGCDFGPFYHYSDGGYAVSTYNFTYYSGASSSTTNSNYPYLQAESTKTGLELVPFIGAKYRFSEHFSASIESCFHLTYFISKKKYSSLPIINNTGNAIFHIADESSSGLEFYIHYIRFLTLNYHL